MKLIYLSLGSNLGSRDQNIEEAIKLIQSRIGVIEKVSLIYESEAWGFFSENSFYNCCLSLRTQLNPLPLLDELLKIEKEMGRIRLGSGYSDRIIDIDLLFYGQQELDHPRLIIPHPSMGDRRFVMHPLAEIAPELLHPVTGKTVLEMLQECTDPGGVLPIKEK
jgi:2-amino-4-hydroxy-6-hydroxymethyldihydropteridine diphosphokinase